MLEAALVVAAYLLGSVCFGVVFARRAGIDLREVGSGNVGATNAGRALGAWTGRAVMALDLLKGLAAMLVASALDVGPAALVAVGVAAVLGHVFPVYFGFRGGKGAATSAGVLLGMDPLLGAAALVAFALLKKLSRRASVASLGASFVALTVALARDLCSAESALAGALASIVVLTHRDNIGRLLRGEEPTT